MSERYEIRLSGSGGQGLILSSIIFASAAAEEGYFVAQSQSYGPEARGGASRAEIIMSRTPVNYPLVQIPDVFLALTEEAYEKHRYAVKEDSIIILDESISGKLYRSAVHYFPIFDTALQLKSLISANMICLGILNKMSVHLAPERIERNISANVPPHTTDINKKAFHSGQDMVKYDRNFRLKER